MFASTRHSHPAVVCVVDKAFVKAWFELDGRPLGDGELGDEQLGDDKLNAAVKADLIRLAEEARLAEHTHPKAVHLSLDEWNPHNGLLNLHWKKARHKIVTVFRPQLHRMLSGI